MELVDLKYMLLSGEIKKYMNTQTQHGAVKQVNHIDARNYCKKSCQTNY